VGLKGRKTLIQSHKSVRLLLAVVAALLVIAAPAHAAFPGANGKIAFTRDSGGLYNVWTMNSDGSGQTQITTAPDGGEFPKWSPDGTRIAYETGGSSGEGKVFVVNADGSGKHEVSGSSSAGGPNWTPDGSKVIFHQVQCSGTDCYSAIYTVNPDGTGKARIGPDPTTQNAPWRPGWSPDGSLIAYSGGPDPILSGSKDVYTMNTGGFAETPLTGTLVDFFEDWSPDASKILGGHFPDGGPQRLYTINRDGSGQTFIDGVGADAGFSPDGKRLASSNGSQISVSDVNGANITPLASGFAPNWQPIPQTYARPKGATPLKTFLVPAYKPCTTPNRTHGTPLAFPSCAPPQQASEWLTIGTADSNGQPTKSVGSVRYDAFSCPACVGPGPNADVRIAVSITDVRKKSDLSDYTGELRLDQALRITDKNNTPNPGGPGPATVSDTSFPTTVPCATTSDTTVGSTCSVMTSANTLVPNAVVAGQRAIWQMGQVQVYDGGADGAASTTGDNTLFMDGGVFIP
jgi:WD40-like Beta Propeller Repeat